MKLTLASVLIAIIGECVASGAVTYTFNGTPTGRPAAPHGFVYRSRGFAGSFFSVQSSAFLDCTRCAPRGVAYFSSDIRFGDSIQFSDLDGGGYIYRFPAGSFTRPGLHSTLPTWPFAGTLKVEVTEDLSVANAAAFDFCGTIETWACDSFTIAPGSIASVFGSDTIASTTVIADSILPLELAGVSVTITDTSGVNRSAGLYFVSPTQVNFLVPPETRPGPATVVVATARGPQRITTSVTTVRPGIFAANSNGLGVPAAHLVRVRPDGLQIRENAFNWDSATQLWVPRPIIVGSDRIYVVLYGTGIRNGSDARVTCYCQANPLNIAETTDLAIAYAGPQPQFPGLDQVNALLPTAKGGGAWTLFWLTVGGKTSNTFRLSFQ
jgi:uncharacterized protein (TIGR03437 family)